MVPAANYHRRGTRRRSRILMTLHDFVVQLMLVLLPAAILALAYDDDAR